MWHSHIFVKMELFGGYTIHIVMIVINGDYHKPIHDADLTQVGYAIRPYHGHKMGYRAAMCNS